MDPKVQATLLQNERENKHNIVHISHNIPYTYELVISPRKLHFCTKFLHLCYIPTWKPSVTVMLVMLKRWV